ncbi:YadA-like family protein [uncultured Sneathia sp.]|uniref:YadA-like family protein n=1 Tax=uncultured Sneathia sp. TaxID=278067 RepID=UPI002805E966|nr:YadA-like family protein [uncultured Sneathia sp.]
MKHLELKELTRYLKKNLKKKVSITKALVISYILTGVVGIQSMADYDIKEDGDYVIRVNGHHVWLGKGHKFLRHNNPDAQYVLIGKDLEGDLWSVSTGISNVTTQNSITYGIGLRNTGLYSSLIGRDSSIEGGNVNWTLAYGRALKASNTVNGVLMVNEGKITNGSNSVIFGSKLNDISAQNGVVIGKKVEAVNTNGAVIIGSDDSGYKSGFGSTWQSTKGEGKAVTAIGAHSQALADAATAVGTRAKASGKESAAFGSNAQAAAFRTVSIGDRAQATLENSVALGSGSKTSASNKEAYLVGKGEVTGDAVNRVLAIGNRRIQGVSAGGEDTDAVNVAQLKAALSKKISFVPVYATPNNPEKNEVGLDGSIKIGVASWDQTDSANNKERFVGENLSTTSTKDGIMIGLKESPKFKSLKLGDNGEVSLSVSDENLLLNSKKIAGLAKATSDNEAVNLSQLKTGEDIDVSKWTEKLELKNLELNLLGNIGSAQKTTLAKGIHYTSPILKIEAKKDGVVHFELSADGENKIKQLSKDSISLKAKENDPIKVEENNGAYTLSLEKDKLKNLVETQNLAGKDLDNLTDKAKGNIKKLLEVKGDKEIKVAKSTDGDKDVYTVSLDDTLKEKINKIGSGTVADNNKGLVTGGQVNQAITNAKNELINKGIQFSGDSGDKITTKLGEEIKFQGGKTSDLTDNNIGVINDNGIMKIKLSNTITGLKAINLGDVKLSNEGLDVGNHKITKLSDGTEDSDAVNYKQLKDVLSKTINKTVINLQADSPMVIAVKDKKNGKLEKVVKDPSDNNYYKISDMNGTKHKDDATPVSKANGDEFVISTIDEDGGLSEKKSIKITKVKDGDISVDSTDAINGSQLAKILGVDGTTYKIGADGKIVKADGTSVYNAIKGNPSTTPTNALEATNAIIDAINKGFKVKADGSETKDKNLGDTITLIRGEDEKDGYSGKNLKTYLTNNGEFALLFKTNPVFKEVTVGDDTNGKTVLSKDGLTIKGKDGKEGKITIDDKGKLAIKNGDKTSTLVTEESAKQNLKLSYKVNNEPTGKSTSLEQGLTFKSDEKDIQISSEENGIIKFNIDKASAVDDTTNKDKLVTAGVIKEYVDKKAKEQQESGNKVTGDNSDGTAKDINDGLNGKTLTEKINALRNGEAGPMVYTDKDGKKLKRGSDGKLYNPDDLNDDGTVKQGKTPVENVELKLNGDNPVALNNVANAVDKVSDLTGDGNLSDGNKAVNKNDLQKVVKAGLNIKGNKGETHQNLGSTLTIQGKENETFDEQKHSSDNLVTKVEEGKVTIAMKKNPEFESVKLGEIELKPNENGTLKLSNGNENVSLTGIKAGEIKKDSSDAINGDQLSKILNNLGVDKDGNLLKDSTNVLKPLIDEKGVKQTDKPSTLTEGINNIVDTMNKGLKFNADNNVETTQYLGSTIEIVKMGEKPVEGYSGNNIVTNVSSPENGKVKFEIGMSEKPEFKEIQLSQGEGKNKKTITLSPTDKGEIKVKSGNSTKTLVTSDNISQYTPIEYVDEIGHPLIQEGNKYYKQSLDDDGKPVKTEYIVGADNPLRVGIKDPNKNPSGIVLTNLAPGKIEAGSKDAVTGGQLVAKMNQIKDEFKGQMENIDKKSDLALGGVANAVAMANLLQVNSYSDYRHNISAAYGYYGRQHALAVGFSGVSENRRINYRISGSVNTQGNLAFGGGIGIMLGNKEERYTDKLEKLNVAKLHDRIDELEKDKISDRKEIENLKRENQEIKEMLKKILKK